MKNKYSLGSFAFRNLKRNKIRTSILLLSIGLLVASLVFSLTFIWRVNDGIRIASARLGADILVVPTGSRGAAEDVLLENKIKTFYMDRKVLERLQKIKDIDRLTHQTYLVTMPSMCCSAAESIVIAFDQATDFIIRPWLAESLQKKLGKGEAIVGKESSYNIEYGLADVESVLFGNVFKKVGVLESTGTGLDNAIFISEENIEDILKNGKADLKPGKISIVFVKVKTGVDPKRVANAIDDAIIEVDAVARKDIGKGILHTLNDMKSIFLLWFIAGSLLSIFLAWAIFTAIANERTREIGIIKAIGASDAHITRLFLTEVLTLGLAGSVLGIGAGALLSTFFLQGFNILKNLPVDTGVTQLLVTAAAGLAGGIGICVAGALLPLVGMRKTDPINILKRE